MQTLKKVRKPVHHKCFGIEIECLVPREIKPNQYFGFFYAGTDGSISDGWGQLSTRGLEFVSQPLPYEMLGTQIKRLSKRLQKWDWNDSCGIHVHVSRNGVSEKRLKKLFESFKNLSEEQTRTLFGRAFNNYCRGTNSRYSFQQRTNAINFTNEHTIEFRMFSGGDANWAQECLRRTKIMCEYKGKPSYEGLLAAFTEPGIK